VRLDPAAVAELASHCLGTDVLPAALAKFLERHAEGRPYFVEEMLAGLLDDATLAPADGGWRLDARATARVPQTYAAWMAQRLGTAGPVVAWVLQAAAVLGREFDATLLAPMTGAHAETVDSAPRAGVRMQVLGPAPGCAGPAAVPARPRARRGPRNPVAHRAGGAGRCGTRSRRGAASGRTPAVV
jgi:hypothetical protein